VVTISSTVSDRVSRRQFVCGVAATGLLASTGAGVRTARAASSPLVWTADVGGAIREYATTADAVFVGTDQNRVRRVDRVSGERTAAVDLDAAVSHGGIAVTDSHLVVVTDDDRLSAYRRADLGGSSVDPVYQMRLSGRVFGMDTNGEAVCVATRDALLAVDLAEPSVRWQTLIGDFDAEYLGQPVVWSAGGIVVGVDDHVAFVAPDTGDVDVPVTFESPNYWEVSAAPREGSVTTVGQYVAFTGPTAHGCCPNWGTVVFDTDLRDTVYTNFSKTATVQRSGSMAGTTVVHQRGEGTVLFRDVAGDAEFQTKFTPHSDGLVSTDARTFVADTSGEAPTTLVAVENDGYATAWSAEVDRPVGSLSADGDLLFGVDAEGGQLFAFAESGDGAALRPSSGTEPAPPSGEGTDPGTPVDAAVEPADTSRNEFYGFTPTEWTVAGTVAGVVGLLITISKVVFG
jgi:hypothetical protein